MLAGTFEIPGSTGQNTGKVPESLSWFLAPWKSSCGGNEVTWRMSAVILGQGVKENT